MFVLKSSLLPAGGVRGVCYNNTSSLYGFGLCSRIDFPAEGEVYYIIGNWALILQPLAKRKFLILCLEDIRIYSDCCYCEMSIYLAAKFVIGNLSITIILVFFKT